MPCKQVGGWATIRPSIWRPGPLLLRARKPGVAAPQSPRATPSKLLFQSATHQRFLPLGSGRWKTQIHSIPVRKARLADLRLAKLIAR